MHVYVIFHMYGERGYTICHIVCTEGQAKRVCEQHPTEQGMTMQYRKFRLFGFPWVWVAFGAAALAFILVSSAH